MCMKCEVLGAGKCETEGHSMEFGDGLPDDFCTGCGMTQAAISAWNEAVRKADLKFARAAGNIGAFA